MPNLFEGIKDFISQPDEDDEEYEEDEYEDDDEVEDDEEEYEEDEYEEDEEDEEPRGFFKSFSKKDTPKEQNVSMARVEMVVLEPRSFNDEKDIVIDNLKAKKACVINTHRLESEYRQRYIDYIKGAVYALDGQFQEISEQDVYLVTPKDVNVDGSIEK